MKKIATLNKRENVISVDCQNKKMYFNGNEIVKMSSMYNEGVLTQEPYAALKHMCNVDIYLENLDNGVIVDRDFDDEVTNEEMQKFLDNNFEFYALTYKDRETNKEHFVVDDGSEWRECGCGYDSIDGWHDTEFNEYVVAYGRNEGKKADAIVMEKPYLYYNGYCNE